MGKNSDFKSMDDLESAYEERFKLVHNYKSSFLMEIDQCKSMQAKIEVLIRHQVAVQNAMNNSTGEKLKKMIFLDEITDLKILKDNAEAFPDEVVKKLEADYGVLKKSDFKKLSPGIKENISLDTMFCVETGALGKTTKDPNACIFSLMAIKKLNAYFTDFAERNNIFDHESDAAFKDHVRNNYTFPGNTSYTTAIVIANELKILSILDSKNMKDEFVAFLSSIYKIEKISVESGLKGMMDPNSKAYCYNKKNVLYASNYFLKLGYHNKVEELKKRYPNYFKE